MTDAGQAIRTLASLEVEARRAAQTGQEAEASRLWAEVLAISPAHPGALSALAAAAQRRGDSVGALHFLKRLAQAAPPGQFQPWFQLARASRAAGEAQAELDALQAILAEDPCELMALILKANALERLGQLREAIATYGAVTAVSPPLERLTPELRPAVTHARAMIDQDRRQLETFLGDRLGEAKAKAEAAGGVTSRFAESVDILLGKQRRYVQEPTHFYFPGLANIGFFNRADFPWLDGFEAASEQIRDEFVAVHETDRGFTPYVAYPPGAPVNQFAELNHSGRWNAFHLYKTGDRIAANADRCPATMALLETAPQPHSANRSPAAMYSLLAPRTRIPPHTGVANTRLVVHVPLIVPPGCGFRVGAETRPWKVGEAWVFDDTIEHEAWNDSDELRVVLIFDIWRPDLSPVERDLIVELMKGLDAYGQGGEGGGL